jgi:tetratricopeptide (TPR) repeat protein
MRRIAPSLLLIVLVAACASAQKAGDQAAATGDWKTAEASYAQVLRDDPNDPEKRARWQNARQQALQASLARCRACQVSQDWECAFDEAAYLARMEPGSAEHAALRSETGRQAAHARLRLAAEAAQRGDHRAAFGLLAQARAASSDAGVQAEAGRLQPGIVSGAVKRAMELRSQQQYPEALELLAAAAALDGAVRPTLEQVRGEQYRWLEARYEAEAGHGDAFLREERFTEAAQAYEAAVALRRGGRAEPLARYARALQAGDAAVQRRDWPAATRAYDEALRTGMDGTGGFARHRLDRVQVRTWAIRVRSALVRPIQPDGQPWAGSPGAGYQRLVGLLANAAMDGKGRRAVAGIDLYDALPHENRPNLAATMTLPDGRQFSTAPQTALRARFESFVVVATNALDDRPLAIRITHADAKGTVEVGAVTVRMADLLNGGELVLSDRSVVEMRLAAERSGQADGSVQGFAPVGQPQGLAAANPATGSSPSPKPRK